MKKLYLICSLNAVIMGEGIVGISQGYGALMIWFFWCFMAFFGFLYGFMQVNKKTWMIFQLSVFLGIALGAVFYHYNRIDFLSKLPTLAYQVSWKNYGESAFTMLISNLIFTNLGMGIALGLKKLYRLIRGRFLQRA